MTRVVLTLGLLTATVVLALSQNTTLSNITGEVANLMGGDTDAAIIGFNVQKTSGSPDINGVTVTFTSDPTGVFSNMKLFKSTDASHGPADVELGTFSLVSGNTYSVSFSAETVPAGSTLNFFIAVDVDPEILSTTSIGATVSNSQLSLAGGTASGAAAGPVYTGATITELTATLGSLNAGANNVAPSPLISSSSGNAVFGFSLVSNGSQVVTKVRIQFTADPTTVFTSYQLVRSSDTDYQTANTLIPALTFTPSAMELEISGLSEDISSAENYFLVATVSSSVTSGTPTIQASLGSSDIDVPGHVAGSSSGVVYSFDALASTVTQLTTGVAPSPLGNNATNQAVLGFSISSNGATQFTAIDILTTTNPTGKFLSGTARLFESSNNSFGGDAEIVDAGGYTLTFMSDRIRLTNLAQDLSGVDRNYFLVVDVDPSIDLSASPAIQPSFGIANVTISGGGLVTLMPGTPITGTNYSFVDSSPPVATITTVGSSPNVSVLGNLTITFNEPILKTDGSAVIDGDLIPALVVLKTPNAGGSAVAFTATINAAKTVITIDPGITLSPSTAYYLAIGPVEDALGNESVLVSTTFTTESAPSITNFTPTSTCVGESVVITGTNFGSNPTIDPQVLVNGVAAVVTAHSNTSITFTVPNATTGSIQVINSENTLSVTSGSNLTVKPAIITTLPITVNPAAPAASQNYQVQVGSTQTTVTYRISENGGGYTPAGGTTGTGGTISFGNFNHAPGSYSYTIQASSSNCATQVFPAVPFDVTIASLEANAGADRDICQGETTVLGDTPAATGGTGFHKFQWTGPSGFTSTLANPEVSVAGTYTLTVSDNSGNTDAEDVVVTVLDVTPASELNITLDPNANGSVYSNKDEPVELTFAYTGALGAGSGFFSGTGVNPSANPDLFYPAAANIGFNMLSLNYTNANGCLTVKNFQVQVFDNSSNFTGFETSYCYVNKEDQVTPSLASYTLEDILVWHYNYTTSAYTTDHIGVTNTAGVYTFNPEAAANGYINSSGFAFVYLEAVFHLTADPTQKTSMYRYTIINQLPDVKIKQFDVDEICKNDASIKLAGFPQGGVWSGSGSSQAPGNNGDPEFQVGEDGLGIFNPANASVGNVTATYTYKDINGCQNSASDDITVKNIPTIDFSFSNKCVGEVVNFVPSQTLPAGVTITNYSWAFGDETTASQSSFTNPTTKTYTNASIFNVNLRVTANNGCVVTTATKQINIGEVPTIDFIWTNVCEGSPTNFQATVGNLGTSSIQFIAWDFTGSGYGPNGPPSDVTKSTSYTPGSRTAKVRVTTNKNCVAEQSKFVYTVPRLTPDDLPYRETFDSNDGEWVTGISNATPSSWEWGAPAKTNFNTDASGSGKAWVTSLTASYNASEQSWVHSPCINLTLISRPILQVDIRSLTREQIDGAVLQYNYKNTTGNEADWVTVGEMNGGDNWYTHESILSNPGNQALKQTGWTGDINPWTNAKYPLDGVIAAIPPAQRDKVRFRFAFASSNFSTELEGFAFDNFDIHQRDRLVIIESFTNNGGENDVDEPNKLFNNNLNNFVTARDGEVIKLEYHVGLGGPNEDPIYEKNQTDANARAAYYGVASTPKGFIDAILPNVFIEEFDEQTLKGALARIDTIFTPALPANMLNVVVRFTPLQPLPANTTLHIAVIEKQITAAAALGTNGENQFAFVMRKMIPDALGTRYMDPLAEDIQIEETYSWSPDAFDFDQIAIIAFLQNEITHEIYQSRILEDPTNIPDPDLITGREPSLSARVDIYPNPVDKSMSLSLPAKTRETIKLQLTDSFGRAVINDEFQRGEKEKLFETGSLSAGMYILRLETESEIIHKKVMIVHE
jgi:hypothetical protein